MQPNQENNIPTRPVAARRPMGTRPVSTARAGASAPVDNGPTFGNGTSVVGAKGGGKTGWILAIILLLLIAAGGVGFGVWAYMDGNNTKNSLNAQIADLQQQNNELQEQIEEITINSNTVNGVDSEEDYVYIGETDYLYIEDWGIKIRIPQELTQLSYYLDKREDDPNNEYLYINGVLGVHDNKPSFIGAPSKFSLGCLRRTVKDAESFNPLEDDELIVSMGGYDYYYGSSQMPHSTDEEEEKLEVETINAMANVFNDPENYSEI